MSWQIWTFFISWHRCIFVISWQGCIFVISWHICAFVISWHRCTFVISWHKCTFVISWQRWHHLIPLDMKGCICHFEKWQIHPFKSKWTICLHLEVVSLYPDKLWTSCMIPVIIICQICQKHRTMINVIICMHTIHWVIYSIYMSVVKW